MGVQQKIKPTRNVGQIAPWITYLIDTFSGIDEFELHVISPHQYIRRTKYYTENNIDFHFVNQGIPLWGRNWPSIFPYDLWTDYSNLKRKIRAIIENINPDIIHLFGAENTYHSSAILQFKDLYPVLISVQGFISKSRSEKNRIMRRKKREAEIYKSFRHFGYQTETMARDIHALNQFAELYLLRYPSKKINIYKSELKYDIVFFARVTKEKGIEDLLYAVSKLKVMFKDIKVCIIGQGKLNKLKEIAENLDIHSNIYWAGFLPTLDEVHKLASSAKICVLPTYHDIISGTIVESLFLGLPVVAYDVGSIHEVNCDEDIITLVEKGDIEGLAEAIKELMLDEELRKQKSKLGREYALSKFVTDGKQIKMIYLQTYEKVIEDFRYSK